MILLFSTVHDPSKSANLLSADLQKILGGAFKWKTLFNPHVTKKSQEVIFSHKNNKTDHPFA